MLPIFSLINNYFYDFSRYLQFSSAVYPPESLNQLEAKITARYHNIEKGLALKEVKLGFGKEKIQDILNVFDKYISLGYDQNRKVFQNTLSVLDEYIAFHKEKKSDVSWLELALNKYQNTKSDTGGTDSYSKQEIVEESKKSFEHLAFARHSIRDFSGESVDTQEILKAIKIAQQTPSVCNRQSSRVYIIKDQDLKKQVLAVHRGNSGFGQAIDIVLIVTANLEAFTSIGERNQNFVDGGMFGMSLIYALQSLGLATCTLNWSAPKSQDQLLRKVIKIKDSENVIFLIGVGHYPEKFKVAKSLRNAVEEIVTKI